ncbi:MAG: EFR1 family ferrodoxin [Pseudomonadota bacterium]
MKPNTSPKKTLVLYYSCSQNTARLAKEAESAIRETGWQVELAALRDFLKSGSPEKPDFIVLGTPVQYFTVPEAALKMIRNLPNYHGTPAFVFTTYGGCVSNAVPYLLANELSQKGARVIGGAQFLAPHSCRINGNRTLGNTEEAFGKGRPNDKEVTAFRTTLSQLINRIETAKDNPIDPDRMKISTMGLMSTVMETFSTLKLKRFFMPHVAIKPGMCSGCKQCSMVCDSGSIAYDTDGMVLINRNTCTKCYACIEQCPEDVLTTNWKQAELLVRTMNKIAKNTTTTIVS